MDTPNIGDPLSTGSGRVTNGTITAGGHTGGTVTLTGTATQINAALAGATYSGGHNLSCPASDTLTVATTDTTSGNTFSTTAAITVVDTTTVSETVLPITVAENTATLPLSNYVTVADTPNIGDPLSTVLTVTNGTITAGGHTGATVTLTGTAAQINAALAGATYSGGHNYNGPDTLTVATTDTTSGNTFSTTAAITVVDTTTVSETVLPITVNENTAIGLGPFVTVADTPNIGDPLSTVLTVTNGTITAGGHTGATVTLTGTAAQINAALAGATYSGGHNYNGPDTLTVATTDSVDNSTFSTTAAITVNGLPVISVPGAQTFDVNEATAITGVSVSETGNTTGETFTVKLTDTHGNLSANTSLTGGGGTITNSGTKDLVISGTLSQVYADLGTLSDTDVTAGSDTIMVNATDSFGNSATQQTIAVTADAQNETPEPPTLSLTSHTATVSDGGTVRLPSINVTANDSDDKLTVTIAGLPTGATITDSADTKVFSGSSFVLTGNEVGSTLTLHDGTNAANFTLQVTANNTNAGRSRLPSASQNIAVTVNQGPAGVAGSPINLALANPPAANGKSVAITVTGVPSDWQLNEGINLGNGTWTIQTDDLSTLTAMTAATYAGAMALGVTETWINADGSAGIASVTDNVEAYAPGAPIFAWSGADTLTGAGGNDLFVFAQPIGNDTIYNFNVASDKNRSDWLLRNWELR